MCLEGMVPEYTKYTICLNTHPARLHRPVSGPKGSLWSLGHCQLAKNAGGEKPTSGVCVWYASEQNKSLGVSFQGKYEASVDPGCSRSQAISGSSQLWAAPSARPPLSLTQPTLTFSFHWIIPAALGRARDKSYQESLRNPATPSGSFVILV